MRLLNEAEPLRSGAGSAVTIGVFDGLHRGHQWLLRRLRKTAGADLALIVVTFDPHPLQLLRPVAAPRLLTDIDQRVRLLERTGLVDACLVLRFDAARRDQPAEAFIEQVLVEQLAAREVMVGCDFRFGHGRAGDVALLERAGAAHAFTVHGIPLLPIAAPVAAAACSSTHIRGLIARGRVDHAALLLDRPHEVRGVVAGTSRPVGGRGTPTAVVRVAATAALPLEGSYAGALITSDGRRRAAGLSIRQGLVVREQALVDVHLAGDISSLVDQPVTIAFDRPIWAADRSELAAAVLASADELGQASAAGGWGAAG